MNVPTSDLVTIRCGALAAMSPIVVAGTVVVDVVVPEVGDAGEDGTGVAEVKPAVRVEGRVCGVAQLGAGAACSRKRLRTPRRME